MYMPERSQAEIFADNLSRILANKNMSQNQLSKKIEVSAMSVNAWCRGLSMPRNDKIDRMCQVLNVTRNDLLQDKTAAPNLSVPDAHPVMILGTVCVIHMLQCSSKTVFPCRKFRLSWGTLLSISRSEFTLIFSPRHRPHQRPFLTP